MLFLWILLLAFECQLQRTVFANHRINETFLDAQVDDFHVELIDDDDNEASFSEEEKPHDDLLEINLDDIVNLGKKVSDANWLADRLVGSEGSEGQRRGRWRLGQLGAGLVSAGCLADLAFWVDSLAEYVWAQHELASNCPRSDPKSGMFNCSCATAFEKALNRSAWAIDVIDSMGRLSTGSMKGNLWMLGDYEQCRQISVAKDDLENDRWEGRYSRVDIFFYKNQLIRPFFEHEYSTIFFDTDTVLNTLQLPSSKPECDIIIQIKFGFCMPKTCSKADVKKLIGYVSQIPQKLFKKRVVCAADLFYHGDQEVHKDSYAIILTLLLIGLVALVIFGTIYDLKIHDSVVPLPRDSTFADSCMSKFNLQDDANKPDLTNINFSHSFSLATKILLSFSLISNAKKLFDLKSEKGSGRITCIHGIRALSIIWVILAHTYSNGLIFVDNVLTVLDMPKYILNQIILNGSLSVDAFFLVGGTLLAYLWLKEMKKTKGENVMNPKTWFMFYLHRYLRLTPVYALILAIEIILVKYSGDGPLWSVIGFEQSSCSSVWWANLLYINNFVDLKNMCMVWSWYLANDMQFFVFSPPLLIVLWMNFFAGISLISVLLFGTTILRGLIIISNPGFPPVSILFNDFEKIQHMEDFSRLVYIKPYCRCGPYLLGLLLGAVLFRCELKAKISKVMNVTGWILASTSGFVALFGVFEFCKTGVMSPTEKFLYGSSARTLWAAFVAWIIFVCANGSGGVVGRILSSKRWRPISRLSYCAYLVHPIMVMYFYAIFARPVHYGGHFQLGMYFVGHMFVTFVVAFVLCCGFEMPVNSLENLLFKRRSLEYRPLRNLSSRVNTASFALLNTQQAPANQADQNDEQTKQT